MTSTPPKPAGVCTKVWKDWQRCCRRGYRQPTLADWEQYRDSFGTKPQQGISMRTVTRPETVTKTRAAYSLAQMGAKAFNELKARIEAGKAPSCFVVKGNEVHVQVKRTVEVKERVKC